MVKIDFVKVEGGGNDFVLIDMIGKKGSVPINFSKIVPIICKRKYGVGADGVLLLQDHNIHNFTMRIFNPDGSEVEMCGNGARCSAYYYAEKVKKGVKEVKFATQSGIMKAKISGHNKVKLFLPPPTGTRLDILLNLGGKELSVSYINTGVPHVVVETDDVDKIDLPKLGRAIRYHGEFAPDGTNVDFIEVLGKSDLKMRTYERGVEGETLACGTGVVASSIIGSLKLRVSPPVSVKTEGGEVMKVYFKQSDRGDLISAVYDVKLEGKVSIVFEGTLKG